MLFKLCIICTTLTPVVFALDDGCVMVFSLPAQSGFAGGDGGAVVPLTLLYRAGLMTQYINECPDKKGKKKRLNRRTAESTIQKLTQNSVYRQYM